MQDTIELKMQRLKLNIDKQESYCLEFKKTQQEKTLKVMARLVNDQVFTILYSKSVKRQNVFLEN